MIQVGRRSSVDGGLIDNFGFVLNDGGSAEIVNLLRLLDRRL